MTELPATALDGPVTMFYPTTAEPTHLTRGPFVIDAAQDGFDGLRKWIALLVIRHRFNDTELRSNTEPRIAAIVAGVPTAADFDLASLVAPRVPLALVTAENDRWLVPRFHSDRVLAACKTCEHIADIRGGGHGALLSPVVPNLTGLIGDLLNDPPGFDRHQMPAVHRKVADFFSAHLLANRPTISQPIALAAPIN